jgi:hypothetical protein
LKDTLENDPVGKRGLDIMMVTLRYYDKDNSIFDFVSLVGEVWRVDVLVT